ncbi:MAG: amidohydrolase family protein [Rikenellaceae bacterium]
MKIRKIAALKVLSPSGDFYNSAVVSFDEKGVVVAVEENVENLDSLSGVEYYDGVLMPGMVNGHCHLELSYLKDTMDEGNGLVEFIRRITSIRRDYTFEEQQQKAMAEDRKMWSEGVQGLCDISNGEASFEAKRTSNLLYHTYAEYFNMPSDDEVEGYYAAAVKHIEPARELGLSISQTPHSNYMVGDKMYLKSTDSERLSIHFMETPSEVEYFEKKGGMYDFVVECEMTPDFLHYGGHVERLIGSLRADTPLLLVHCTMMTQEQLEAILGYFTDVTFVLCPRSNYFIERATPPAMMLMKSGANVALGTDSLTSNHSLSMAAEIEMLLRDNPELPLGVALKWATLGGARGLKAENRIGSFEVGKSCGVVLLEGVNLKTLRPEGELSSRRIL